MPQNWVPAAQTGYLSGGAPPGPPQDRWHSVTENHFERNIMLACAPICAITIIITAIRKTTRTYSLLRVLIHNQILQVLSQELGEISLQLSELHRSQTFFCHFHFALLISILDHCEN